jgi:hypothetical protein
MHTPGPSGALLATAVLAAGCSFTPSHTITSAEAIHQIDAYLRETIKSAPVRLNFTYREVEPEGTGCIKWYSDSDPTGQVSPSITYRAAATDSEATNFLHAAAIYWMHKSASVTKRPPDAFSIKPNKHYGLLVSYYGESHILEVLGGIDDCIWPHGTPESERILDLQSRSHISQVLRASRNSV